MAGVLRLGTLHISRIPQLSISILVYIQSHAVTTNYTVGSGIPLLLTEVRLSQSYRCIALTLGIREVYYLIYYTINILL